ncbi:MAG: hypothetical protein R3257_07240 [bacterium]|nr:hypothetical protein [bacterium]
MSLNPKHYELRSITTFREGTLLELKAKVPHGVPKHLAFFDQNHNQELDENDVIILGEDNKGTPRAVTPEDIRTFGNIAKSAFQLAHDHRREMYQLVEGQRSGSCAYFRRPDRFAALVGVKFDPPLSLKTRTVAPEHQYSERDMDFNQTQEKTYNPAKCVKASEAIAMDSILGSPLNRFRRSMMIQIGNRHLNLAMGNPLGLSNGAGLDVYYSLEGERRNTRMVHLDL